MAEAKLAAEKLEREEQNAITHLKLEADKAISAVKLADKERNNVLDKMMIEANTKAFADKITSISPNLIAALNALAEHGLLKDVAKSISPYLLASDGNESVSDVVRKLTGDKVSINEILNSFQNKIIN